MSSNREIDIFIDNPNTDDGAAIRVCAYCFCDLNLSMFGIEDDFCSQRCKGEWDAWFAAAKDVQS